MDGFTAGLLLQAATTGKEINSLIDLAKKLDVPANFTPCGSLDTPDKVRDFVNANVGANITFNNKDYTGTIHKYNESRGGFYCGLRYPMYVRITGTTSDKPCDAVGYVYEYGVDEIATVNGKPFNP